MFLPPPVLFFVAFTFTMACNREMTSRAGPLSTRSAAAGASFREGLELFDLLRMNAARTAFQASLQADPAFALARAYLALSMNRTGDVQGELARALKDGATASPTERLFIEAAKAWNDFDRAGATAKVEALLKTDPLNQQAHFQLGVLRYEARAFDDAAASFRKVTELDPAFKSAWLHLARAEARADHRKEARDAVAHALALSSEEPFAYQVLGDVHLQSGECDPALVAYTTAIAQDPGLVPAYQGRAYCYRLREDFAAARKEYEMAFARASVLPDAAYKELMLDWNKAEDISFDVAQTYLFEGNNQAAIEGAQATVDFANKARPDNAVFYYNSLGRIYLENNRLREALEVYRNGEASIQRVSLSEQDKTLWHGRFVHAEGRIHAKAGRFGPALAKAAELKAMIERAGAAGEPYRKSYHYLIGYVFLEKGEARTALEHLKQADAEDPFVQWLMARAYVGTRDPKQALALLDHILEQKGSGFRYALVRDDALSLRERLRAKQPGN